MLRRILLVLLMLGAGFLLAAGRGKKSADPVFRQIAPIVHSLSQISGLAEEHPIPYGRMDHAQLRHFLKKRIKKNVRSQDIRTDEIALKMLGLVPQDFDLKKSTLDLLTEQAAAFYDYDSKKLYLLSSDPPAEQTIALAHELAHALADQHFDLSRFLDEEPQNEDQELARTAVAEGEASWLMIAYDLKLAGRAPVPEARMLRAVLDSSENSTGDFSVLKSSPLYIRENLLFPYTEGALFFNAVYKRMGKRAFAAVFTDPPVDTAQIMQPEKYFQHIAPLRPHLPKLDLPKGKQLGTGVLGEFDHEMLLRQYGGAAKARTLSRHLLGGTYAVSTAGKQRTPVLEYASAWDTPAHAARFFAEYEKILRQKWTHCDPALSTASAFAGKSDSGFFVVRLEANTVTSVEGLPDRRSWMSARGLRW